MLQEYTRIKKIILLFGIGIIYLVIARIFNYTIICPIFKITGFYCPGCGISRMFVFLSKGEFYMAFRSNMAIFLMIPVILYLIIKNIKSNLSKFDNKIAIFLCIVLIFFGILRNTSKFDYLKPIVENDFTLYGAMIGK